MSFLNKETDVIVIGSGISGFAAALKCSDFSRVLLICKDKLAECNTSMAQGGVAVPVSTADSEKLHIRDTMKTGADLSDRKAAELLAVQARNMLKDLEALGVKFDKTNGTFDLRREGAHSVNRIVHVKGDYTGREIESVLIKAVKEKKNIKVLEREFLVDLIIRNKKCRGVYSFNRDKNNFNTHSAKAVLLATGGIGQLYMHTSNSIVTTGDGIASAYRAGALLMDMEFVQFHPTALYVEKGRHSRFKHLITETLRGEGAVLVNRNRKKFMMDYHSKAELSSRDVVSRAIFKEMQKTKTRCVFLDISNVKNFKAKFPQIAKICRDMKVDLSGKLIPVVPTAHYFMGGIKTNLKGQTNINGLFASGEAACTGLHGANRLASNSLPEGYISSERAALEIKEYISKKSDKVLSCTGAKKTELNMQELKKYSSRIEDITSRLKQVMWKRAGVFRCGRTLSIGLKGVKNLDKEFTLIENKVFRSTAKHLKYDPDMVVKFFELKNMLLTAKLVMKSALKRTESRGAHYRSDYPKKNDKKWKKHIAVKKAKVG
ncbi:MAG: L-aspartate oxidase [Armatimonadota bacterium]